MEGLDKRMLGRNIRRARLQLGLTQEQMAERIEMAPEVYGRMERGYIVPRLERFVTICRVLGETPDRLLPQEEVPETEDRVQPQYSAANSSVSTLQRAISSNLRKARLHLGLTQAQMATLLHMNVGTYGRMERGSLLPGMDSFVAICRLLGQMSDNLPPRSSEGG